MKLVKSQLVDISDKYENILSCLHAAKYLLRVQARHEEANALVAAVSQVQIAVEVQKQILGAKSFEVEVGLGHHEVQAKRPGAGDEQATQGSDSAQGPAGEASQ